tara:strand:- start:872 stop:1387 length:516 start_codon:yes stop_codon:yes gene_type:complete
MLQQFTKRKTATYKNHDTAEKMRSKKLKSAEQSDSEISDSDDSDYEELLVADLINKAKIKDVPEVKKEKEVVDKKEDLPAPLPLERQETKPIAIPKKSKSKRTVVIKKYYQRKEKPSEKPVVQVEKKIIPLEKPVIKKPKYSYLGFPMDENKPDIIPKQRRDVMTSRIFNW